MKHLVATTTALIALAVCAPAASAEVRSLDVSDPQDAIPTVSGQPDNPDISRVQASYDTAGSITITVSFYNALNSLDTSHNYAFFGNFDIGHPSDLTNPNATCSADVMGQNHVFSNYETFYDQASVIGYNGELPFSRTMGTDGKSVTISASSPTIANRDFRCITYDLMFRWVDSASDPPSNYDANCDCWYRTGNADSAGANDRDGLFHAFTPIWFDGFAPGDPAPTPQPKRTPTLNWADAKEDGLQAFRLRHFHPRHFRISCHRVSRTRFACQASFVQGRFRYRGSESIWLAGTGNNLFWYYSYRMRRSDGRVYVVH